MKKLHRANAEIKQRVSSDGQNDLKTLMSSLQASHDSLDKVRGINSSVRKTMQGFQGAYKLVQRDIEVEQTKKEELSKEQVEISEGEEETNDLREYREDVFCIFTFHNLIHF